MKESIEVGSFPRIPPGAQTALEKILGAEMKPVGIKSNWQVWLIVGKRAMIDFYQANQATLVVSVTRLGSSEAGRRFMGFVSPTIRATPDVGDPESVTFSDGSQEATLLKDGTVVFPEPNTGS